MTTLLCSAIVVLASVHALAAQRVWVVAPTSGAGVDFTAIQPAITAAASGDTVLVRSGTYEPFEIVGKGLVVVGDGRVDVFTPNVNVGIAVRSTTVNQSVLVRGFDVLGRAGRVLHVEHCAGPVMVERSTFATAQDLRIALVTNSARVTLAGCWFDTGTTRFFPPTSALVVVDSTVFMFDSLCRFNSVPANAKGGAGAMVERSTLYASGSVFVGGDGSPALLNVGQCFFPPRDGGDALQLIDPTSRAHLVECDLIPGNAGANTLPCPPASPGLPTSGPGMVSVVTGLRGDIATSELVRAGQIATFQLGAPPAHALWLALSTAQDPVFVPGCSSALHPDLQRAVVLFAGIAPPSGRVTLTFPVPAVLHAQAVTLFTQVAVASPTACRMGTPSAITLVDRRF